MSARKTNWLKIAKSFVKVVKNENTRMKANARRKITKKPTDANYIQPTISINVSDDSGKEYINGFVSMQNNAKYEESVKISLSFLVSFYKEHAQEYNFEGSANPVVKLLKELFPLADSHTCPYCGVIHDFTASRARKCPDCGNQMIVRQRVFLKEEQVAKLDKAISEYYDKAGLSSQLKNCVEQIQSYLSDCNYGRAFLGISEGYQCCAAIYNKKYEGGYSAWDYSWRTLNGEAFQIAGSAAKGPKSLIANGYSDVIFARGMHFLRRLKYTETTAAINKYAKMAIAHFFGYLLALNSVDLSDGWQQETAIKNIIVAELLGNVSKDEVKEIMKQQFSDASPKPTQEIYIDTIREVEEYIFLETDLERLKQLIY